MNQANAAHSVSKIFYKLRPKRRFRNPDGPEGRLRKISKTLTALIKYERIELNYHRADEVRGYVEQLISRAIRNGPEHKETMEFANFYILEKQYIQKLFKVLVPRYQDYSFNFTKMHYAPNEYKNESQQYRSRAVLELKGNIYPSLIESSPPEHTLLHNILLTEARKEFRKEKYTEIAENMKKNELIKE